MRQLTMTREARAFWAGTTLLASMVFAAPFFTRPATARAAETPTFLRAGQCYRLIFSIDGAPAWKVLEVVDAGWVRAEVDAGPASAQRETIWINTAHIVTARPTRCSD